MLNIVDKYKQEVERLVIYFQGNDGHYITVFSGTIKEWEDQGHPYFSSSIWEKGIDCYNNTLTIEVLDI